MITRSVAALVISLTALVSGAGLAHAEDTVKLTELHTVDGVDYPACAYEDCSDQPTGVGLWEDHDTGNWYLTTPEKSVLVVDDTVR
ncbi:hypothetical protein H7I40_24475 [Mycolicibacterium madagascariense]|nr:hypothetical protein [Mycolicibacterium madagascariense]